MILSALGAGAILGLVTVITNIAQLFAIIVAIILVVSSAASLGENED
jgi:hypothetical protein